LNFMQVNILGIFLILMLLMPFKRLLFHMQRPYSNEIKNALKSNFFKNKPGDLSGFSIDVTDLLKH